MGKPNNLAAVVKAIVRVDDGRGFVVAGARRLGPDFTLRQRYIITAGHCLPHFPPAMSFGGTSDTAYAKLIGPLGAEPTVWADCAFVDPIADIAVLCSPDNQVLGEEADAYDELVDAAVPLKVGGIGIEPRIGREPLGSVWLADLDNSLKPCQFALPGRGIWLMGATWGLKGGMSGGPIVTADGTAVGVFSTSGGSLDDDAHTEGGPEAELSKNLPGWLWEEMQAARSLRRAKRKKAGKPTEV